MLTRPESSSAEPAAGRGAYARIAVLGVALLLGLQGAGFWLFRDRGPTSSEHAQAASYLRARYTPGEVIFMLPSYATEAREYLGDLFPQAVPEPWREDLETAPAVWVYAAMGTEQIARAGFAAAGFKMESHQSFDGGLEVQRYVSTKQPRVIAAWRALDHVPDAQVAHRSGERKMLCSRWSMESYRGGTGGRWICPHDASWFYFGPEWHRMGTQLRRCLWAHPPREGELEISFEDVELTGQLVLTGGHTLNASKRAHAPVHLSVKIGESSEEILTFELEDTWKEVRLKTTTGTTATVRFAVSSPNNGANHFCFVAETRGPQGGEGN